MVKSAPRRAIEAISHKAFALQILCRSCRTFCILVLPSIGSTDRVLVCLSVREHWSSCWVLHVEHSTLLYWNLPLHKHWFRAKFAVGLRASTRAGLMRSKIRMKEKKIIFTHCTFARVVDEINLRHPKYTSISCPRVCTYVCPLRRGSWAKASLRTRTYCPVCMCMTYFSYSVSVSSCSIASPGLRTAHG